MSREFYGHTVTRRTCDGYINATEMCKGKKIEHWRENREFLDTLSKQVGITPLRLVQSDVGNGTWIHPKVADVDLACIWCGGVSARQISYKMKCRILGTD